MTNPLVAQRSLGVVFFPAFDWFITPDHPERQERLLYTGDQLHEEGLFDLAGITEYRPELATYAQIERVHFCLPDAATVCTPSHLAGTGGAIRAGKLVMDGVKDRAFALVRPPGHHAMRVTHGNRGFCNVNMEAVLIEYLRDHYPQPDGKGGTRPLRVAVVDTDCHHGDGSQDIFWNDPNTLFISLHQDGRTLYPGTGFLSECGGPAALGRVINLPLPPQTGDAGYLYVMDHAVLPILEAYQPDIIINSAGQDNHFTDPITNMRLTARGYAALNERLNPHIAVLEGGYSIRGALPYVNLAICLALAGLPYDDIQEPAWSERGVQQRKDADAYIAHLCDEALRLYHFPPSHPGEGSEEGGFWVRHKNIYYDTDMLQDTQREALRLCPDCDGLQVVESHSSRGTRALCLLLPRDVCPHCRELAEQYRRSGQKNGRMVKILDLSTPPAA